MRQRPVSYLSLGLLPGVYNSWGIFPLLLVMSFLDAAWTGSQAAAWPVPAGAEASLRYLLHLQGQAVLLDLRAVHLPSTREEWNNFFCSQGSEGSYCWCCGHLYGPKFAIAPPGGQLVHCLSIKKSILQVCVSRCPRWVSPEIKLPICLLWPGPSLLWGATVPFLVLETGCNTLPSSIPRALPSPISFASVILLIWISPISF